jgi:uncharacterized membrane protein YfcA
VAVAVAVPHLSLAVLGLLALTGFAAGFIDSIAGGGGLIALPVLLGVGLPPQVALGTNKFQSSFGSTTASANFIHKGTVRLADAWKGIVWTALGAAAGAIIIQRLDPSFLRRFIPILLLVVLIYSIFSRRLGDEEEPARFSASWFIPVCGLGLGFYDGFFGPGTGSFWMALLIAGLGYPMIRSAGTTRIYNCTSNLVSVALFLLGGNVYFTAGLAMAAGQATGAKLGSGLAIRKGAGFIRPIFITVVLATILRLIYVS